MLAEDARNLASAREDSQGVNVLTDLGGGLVAYLGKNNRGSRPMRKTSIRACGGSEW